MIFTLIKKDLSWYIFYYMFFVVSSLIMLAQDGFNDGLVIFVGACIMYVMIGSVGLVEILEDRFNGYQILKILPISDIQVIAVKFILPFLLGCMCLVYTYALVDITAPSAAAVTLSRAYIFLTVVSALTIIGLIYILLFRFGVNAVMKFIFYGGPLLLMITLIAVRVIFKDEFHRADVDALMATVADINWWLLVPAAIFFYAGLMLAAADVKKRYMS